MTAQTAAPAVTTAPHARTHHRTVDIDGIEIFYREAGPEDAPTILPLHGFPTSSRMYRHLIAYLADSFHVVAPDYPGFGHSAVPERTAFPYTFDGLADVIDRFLTAIGVDEFALYAMDFGAPVGYRIALRHPDRLTAVILQNAPLYPEAPQGWWETLGKYWSEDTPQRREASRSYLTLDGLRDQYLYGVTDPTLIDPDTWLIDAALIERPGVDEIMLDLLHDIKNNVDTFAAMRQLLIDRRPPVLVATGANDEIFPEHVVHELLKDVPSAEYHALQTGHFALEDHAAEISGLVRRFLARNLREGG